MMRLRYGENFAGTTQAIRYGETVTLNGVNDAPRVATSVNRLPPMSPPSR